MEVLIIIGIFIGIILTSHIIGKNFGPKVEKTLCHDKDQPHKWEYLKTKNPYNGKDWWIIKCKECDSKPGDF